MAKYSFEFKMEVVKAYLSGDGGYGYLAKKYSIPADSIIVRWVKAYQSLGEDGLIRKRQNGKYSLDFKLNVVESYLTTELSYQELALSVGINTPSLITAWVKTFREFGIDGLNIKQGRPSKMKSKDKDNSKSIETEDVDVNILKDLEQENLKLRIENAYLKELRRMRLEEAQKMKELQELSAFSEENSD